MDSTEIFSVESQAQGRDITQTLFEKVDNFPDTI